MAKISHVKATTAKSRKPTKVIDVPPDSEHEDGMDDGTSSDRMYPVSDLDSI